MFFALTASAEEPCRVIQGRADFYSGDGQMFIWHIGTHHTFWVLDDASQERIFKYIPYTPENEGMNSLFADFTICPTEGYRRGASQFVIVKQIAHPKVRRVR